MSAQIAAAAYASAAARIGVPVDEYRARREAGQRWCAEHQRWEMASEFAMRAYPGRQFWRYASSCHDGHREQSRAAMARYRAGRTCDD